MKVGAYHGPLNAFTRLMSWRPDNQKSAMRSNSSKITGSDPLSDVLSTFTLRRVVSARFEASGSFAMRLPTYKHMKIGAALTGAFDLEVNGSDQVVRISTGDCYLLTDGIGYRTRSEAGSGEEYDAADLFEGNTGPDGVVRWGEGEPSTVVIGARFIFDLVGLEWLRAVLPPLIHVVATSPAAAPIRSTLALLAAEEGSGPGVAVVRERLSDVLLVQALRAHIMKAEEGDAVGWLTGLADRRISGVLEAFHRAVGEDWSVEKLAHAGGMSRSSFSAYFLRRVGMTPMAYVSAWRMQRIRHALRDGNRDFAQIAAENGFTSRTAASRAFRMQFGMSPAEARRIIVPNL